MPHSTGLRGRRARIWVCVTAAGIAACGRPAARPAATPIAEAELPTSRLVTYQPFSATYRAASHRQVEQEFNGQRTTSRVEMDLYLSAELVRGEEDLRATMRVDSVPVLTGLSARDAEGLTGSVFTAVLSPTGEIRDFAGSESDADLMRQLALQMREFFPQLLPEGAEPGQHWSDTAETKAGTHDLDLLIRSVNHHQVLGWGQWAGERGLHIETISDYTLTGSGFESGQEYTLEGVGIEHRDQYVASDGRFLGQVSVDTLRSTALLPAIGATIPITQTRTDSLTIVR